jgi:hypothetical protein
MDEDVDTDSESCEAERRATASRGQRCNGISFRDSDGIVRKSNKPISDTPYGVSNTGDTASSLVPL